MPVSRSTAALVARMALCCAAAGPIASWSTQPVAAQGGTVAVTGDGTAQALKPSIGEAGSAARPASPTAKKKNQKKPAGDSDTETASREPPSDLTSGGHAIAALVNDEPVTAFEIDQRAMMLSGSGVQAQAQANFEALIKNPRTTERLKAILREVAERNQGKPRDAVIALFEQRKKDFGMSLQKQAFELQRGRALCRP